MPVLLLIVSFAAAVFVGWLSFRLFFDDTDDFLDCLRLYFTPEIINLFRGEWGDASWADLKLFLYFGFSGGCGLLVWHFLNRLLG